MLINKNKQQWHLAQKVALPITIFVALILNHFFDYKYIVETVVAVLFIWFVYFVITYFRVFQNHELQNVFINQYILKRGYSPKPQTIRQKIQSFQKIQKYNQTYNSNYNNFTNYKTNLPNSKDFTFDLLEIKNQTRKKRLAVLDNNILDRLSKS